MSNELLAEITPKALRILYRELGIVDTVRFLKQYTIDFGNYTEARDALFGHISLDEIVLEVEQQNRGTPCFLPAATNLEGLSEETNKFIEDFPI